MIHRTIIQRLAQHISPSRSTIVLGPRRVGKTTLIKRFLLEEKEYLFLDGDDPRIRDLLTNPSLEELKLVIGNNTIIFIDEAQRIENIGLTVKMIIDRLEDVVVFMSGSSAIYLNDTINEPLTGRKWQYELLPLSYEEIEQSIGYLEAQDQLHRRMLFGSYPEVVTSPDRERMILSELVNSYLYRDVLTYGGIRKPEYLDKLLKMLAYQIGNEVSFNELANQLQIDKNTVAHYIDLLEKSFIIFRLPSYSKNLRNELKKARKLYFYDVGVRNTIINDFSPIVNRQDRGAIWENFLVAEKLKQINNHGLYTKLYFWRNTNQREIDLIEETDGFLKASEMKFNPKAKSKIPKAFVNAYPNSSFQVITPENFRSFLIG